MTLGISVLLSESNLISRQRPGVSAISTDSVSLFLNDDDRFRFDERMTRAIVGPDVEILARS